MIAWIDCGETMGLWTAFSPGGYVSRTPRMATAADIVTALKANPEAREDVLTEFNSGRYYLEAERLAAERTAAESRATAAERELHRKVSRDDDCYLVQHPGGTCTCMDVGRNLRNELREAKQERDALRAELELARHAKSSEREAQDREVLVLTQRAESIARDHAKAVAERDEAHARLASAERVVEAVRVMLRAPPVAGAWEAAAFERKLRADVYNALRDYDSGER